MRIILNDDAGHYNGDSGNRPLKKKKMFQAYHQSIRTADRRITSTESKLVWTRAGLIEYIDYGEGPAILLSHGILGGSDQAFAISHSYLGSKFRIIAVSRFGYLRSPLPADSSPAHQADLYAALLDKLGINKVVMFGFSAGSPSSLQFALRYPERCAVLVLLSPAAGEYKVPSATVKFIMKTFFSSDFLFWGATRYFRSWLLKMAGVPSLVQCRLKQSQQVWLSSLIQKFFPIRKRVKGIMNDICVSNPDLSKNYPVQNIIAPTLIIHAVDDPIASFNNTMLMSWKIPNVQFVQIDMGGHLLMGNHTKVRQWINSFIKGNFSLKEDMSAEEANHIDKNEYDISYHY
ncbi:MAG TPA: alpha/beta hydrolase [Chitinophagaceae bacterium]